MVLFDILISCESQNVKELKYDGQQYEWHFSVQCSKCQSVNENEIYFKAADILDMTDSRGKANFIMKCKQCKNTMTIALVEDNHKNSIDLNNQIHQKLFATFECRGVEPITWNCQGLTVIASSGTIFNDVDLRDTWIDYDESISDNCLIENFLCQFKRSKKQ